MADDKTAAQRILELAAAKQRGELSAQDALDIAQESGWDTAVQQPDTSMAAPEPTPAPAMTVAPTQGIPPSLAANPPGEVPSALAAAQPFVPDMPEITPNMAAASREADAKDFEQKYGPMLQQANMAGVNQSSLPLNVDEVAQAQRQGMLPGAAQTDQASVNQAVQQVAQKAGATPVIDTTPTVQEQHAANEAVATSVRQEIAQHNAVKQASDDLQAQLLRERIAAEEEQAAVRKRLSDLDNQTRTRSLPEILKNGSFGDKFGAALTVMLGGLAQGIGQLKSNPVMDFFDKQAEMQAKKDSLNAEQKMSLQKQLYELGAQRIQALAHASDDAYKKQHLANQAIELQLKAKEMEDNRLLKAMELAQKAKGSAVQSAYDSGKHIDTLEGLSEDARKRAVRLSNGKYASAKNPTAAEQLEKYVADVEPAMAGIERVSEALDKYSKVKNLVGPERNKIETEIGLLAGQLRLPVLGPGQMTKEEYARLRDLIGDPQKLLNISSWERAKLDTLMDKFTADRKEAYKRAGVDLPQTYYKLSNGNTVAEDDLVKQIAKQTNMPEARVRKAIKNQYKGQ